jgi:predicted restriction endonuclease
MSEWSWKQAVSEEVLEIVNSRRTARFELEDLYFRAPAIQQRFPRNRHVREKIRQTLQRLRDANFLHFLGDGEYELNFADDNLECLPVATGEAGIAIPETRTVLRTVRMRNTLLAADLKRRYENTCQICGMQLPLVECSYAESHHVKPLGSPHFGPDIEGNILVACPNHHTMLDRGAIKIDPISLVVEHWSGAFTPRKLVIQPWHVLERDYLAYHATEIFGKNGPLHQRA